MHMLFPDPNLSCLLVFVDVMGQLNIILVIGYHYLRPFPSNLMGLIFYIPSVQLWGKTVERLVEDKKIN